MKSRLVIGIVRLEKRNAVLLELPNAGSSRLCLANYPPANTGLALKSATWWQITPRWSLGRSLQTNFTRLLILRSTRTTVRSLLPDQAPGARKCRCQYLELRRTVNWIVFRVTL